jgi:hypothetical protein
MEPETFQFVAQWLNQLQYHMNLLRNIRKDTDYSFLP